MWVSDAWSTVAPSLRHVTPSTSPPSVASGQWTHAEESALRPREEEAASFCLRALRAAEVAPLLDDTVATAARVLGCELVRVVELREDGQEVVVAVSGVGERAQVFGEGAGSGVEVPMPSSTRSFGILGAYTKAAQGFPPADVGFLRVLAITTGHAVERLRHERAPKADAAAADGSMLHDLRNLLTVIVGNVELLLETYAGDRPPPRELHDIEHAAHRAEALVEALSGPVTPSPRTAGSAPTEFGQAVDR